MATKDQSSAATGRVSGALDAVFAYLTAPANPAHRDLRLEILGTLLLNRSTVLFGAASLSVLLISMAILHSVPIALIVSIAFLASLASRLKLIDRLERKSLSEGDVRHIVSTGLLYATAMGLVGLAASTSEEETLLVLGAIVMTGLAFGFCISNSGAPRYATAQAFIVTVPYLVGSAFSGSTETLLLLLQGPLWLFGIYGLIRTTHARLAQLVEAQRRNQLLAYNDALTGLANRAQVMSSLTQIALDRLQKSPPPYVLYLDLDGFKHVNDNHGHAAGDALLRQVAQRLTQCVRAGDVVGRIGGDEFVIILRDLHQDGIAALAGRITQAIAKPFELGDGITVTVGVSIGGAPLGLDPDASMASADTMLYAAKHGGRGTYRLIEARG